MPRSSTACDWAKHPKMPTGGMPNSLLLLLYYTRAERHCVGLLVERDKRRQQWVRVSILLSILIV